MKFLFLLLILGFSLTAHSTINVLTTTTNLADIVRQIGGDKVDVESLCKGIQDPHYLEAKPSYTFKLSKADLLISIGAGLEVGWLPLVIRGSRNPNIREGQPGHLIASQVVNLLEVDDENISRSKGDVHPEGNPHFMLSPHKSIEVAKAISSKLSDLDLANKEVYEKNANNFEEKMRSLIKEWKAKIPKGFKVISYHKTLTYFYEDFEIVNVDVLEPKPGIPPTASHILGVIDKLKSQKIKKIIVENYFDETVAKRVKKEVPDVQIELVPVAVSGKKGIQDIFSLYEYLVSRIGD
ncbi:MAG: metal ABC transporter substrate-binding protein [Bacteriovoracaceae bacterium]